MEDEMPTTADGFDLDTFLDEPHSLLVATNGPTIRPLWYQWEDGCFWTISGPWAKLYARIQSDPMVALLVNVDERDKGRILHVMARASVSITPYDIPRARRMLHRYLGPDESSWSNSPDDYPAYLREPGPPGAVLLRMEPVWLKTFNFSYADSPYAAAE
jgi:hypothetical protein